MQRSCPYLDIFRVVAKSFKTVTCVLMVLSSDCLLSACTQLTGMLVGLLPGRGLTMDDSVGSSPDCRKKNIFLQHFTWT